MRFIIRFLLLSLLLAPLSQIQAQNPCGVCTPKDTTLAALNAFKAKMGGVDKAQDAKISALQAARSKMQKDIDKWTKLMAEARNIKMDVDTSFTNRLAHMNIELAKLDGTIAELEDFKARQLAWNQGTESHINALDRLNQDNKRRTTGMSTGTKWAIVGGTTAVVVATVLVGNNNHWWGGNTITTNSSSYSCAGSNCR